MKNKRDKLSYVKIAKIEMQKKNVIIISIFLNIGYKNLCFPEVFKGLINFFYIVRK